MSPRRHITTGLWCALTMACTMVLSHGHLIMREILANWPQADSWEGRLENALYSQGGLVCLASLILSLSVVIRGFVAQHQARESAGTDRAQRERHERAAEQRHEAMLDAIARLSGGTPSKKPSTLGPGQGNRALDQHYLEAGAMDLGDRQPRVVAE